MCVSLLAYCRPYLVYYKSVLNLCLEDLWRFVSHYMMSFYDVKACLEIQAGIQVIS